MNNKQMKHKIDVIQARNQFKSIEPEMVLFMMKYILDDGITRNGYGYATYKLGKIIVRWLALKFHINS